MIYLVDTDCVIDLLKGRENARRLFIDLLRDGAAISIVTYGEVYEGIFFGPDPNRSEQGFKHLLGQVAVVGLTRSSMRQFARLRGDLRKIGLQLADADALIASTALDRDLVLVTRNVRHFSRVPSLKLLVGYS